MQGIPVALVRDPVIGVPCGPAPGPSLTLPVAGPELPTRYHELPETTVLQPFLFRT